MIVFPDADGPNSFERSTLMVRTFPSTVINHSSYEQPPQLGERAVGGSLGAIRGHVKDHGAMAGVVPRITFACRNPPLRTFLRHRCHSRTVLLARITVGTHLGAALRYSSYAVPNAFLKAGSSKETTKR